jgi:hypothetical protein
VVRQLEGRDDRRVFRVREDEPTSAGWGGVTLDALGGKKLGRVGLDVMAASLRQS